MCIEIDQSNEYLANMERIIKLPPNPATCLLEIRTTTNNVHVTGTDELKTEPEIVPFVPAAPLVTSKRLGRGVVSSGLTCECGVFGAMACGEWPAQRVRILFGFFQLSLVTNVVFCVRNRSKLHKPFVWDW